MLGIRGNLTIPKDKVYTSRQGLDLGGGGGGIIIIPDHADFNHDNGSTSDFTISFWFKADDTSGTLGENQNLMSRWDLNDKKEWQIYIGTDRVIDFAVSNDGSTDIVNVSTYTVSDSNWHHIYAKYQGGQSPAQKRVLLVVDATTVLSQSVGTPNASNPAEIHEADQDTYIGATHNDGTVERKLIKQ